MPRWDDPERSFESRLLAAAFVSIVIEVARVHFHPESSEKSVLLVSSVLANVAYHMWNMPTDLKRTIASAILGQASMPIVLALIIGLANAIWVAGMKFLHEFIPGV